MADVHVPAFPFPGPGRRLPDKVQPQLVGPAGQAGVVGAFRGKCTGMDMDTEKIVIDQAYVKEIFAEKIHPEDIDRFIL